MAKKYEVCYSIVSQTAGSFTAAFETYYVFSSNPGTMTITLPTPSDGYSHSIFFKFTTGSSVAITWSGTGVVYYSDYAIEASKTYEINALWNGSNWIIAYATIG